MIQVYKNNRSFLWIIRLTLIIILSFNFSGCGGGKTDDRVELTMSASTVNANAEGTFMQVKCDGPWSISFSYPEGEEPWLSADPASGSGNKGNVRLVFGKNATSVSRNGDIIAVSGKASQSVAFIQKGVSVGGGGDPDPDPDPDPPVKLQWKELPEYASNDSCVFVTHYTSVNSKTVRNYSLYYNKNQRMSYWIAYPLHSVYMGSGRYGDWEYDPKVDSRYQVNLSSSGFSSGYDRGHQIPSADRNANKNMNVQTFYSTNATPQKGSFNQFVWVRLEEKVRAWATGDTLYVVTGAILRTVGGNETVRYDRDHTAIPNYYFKVVYSGYNSNHKAIGFWYDHSVSYPNKVEISQARSVAQIEALTGFKFFTNLPQDVQNQIKSSFRAQDWGL